jgi:squalene-hopene/tetraprenyl-beta-curcumene cyclase
MNERIHTAYEKVRRILLDRRTPEGYWIGRLSDSALSTATAVSAFVVFRNSLSSDVDLNGAGLSNADRHATPPKHDLTVDELQQLELLIRQGADWLLAHQNPDGGWGDTDRSCSNVSTTWLVKSALTLAFAVPSPTGGGLGWGLSEQRENAGSPHPNPLPKGEGTLDYPLSRKEETLKKADDYLDKAEAGGADAIKKRYGKDQTFSVPILTNAALAGLVDWKEIPQLPFELAALPMSWFRFVKMNVVSYAIPALVAIGQVRFYFMQHCTQYSTQHRTQPLAQEKGNLVREKGNPVRNFIRCLVRKRTLQLIQDMQPASGGYLEAAPLTAFVVMSLSAMGLTDHPIVTKGIRFLINTVRSDASWPIDTNLATWATTLSVNALGGDSFTEEESEQLADWILSCQHTQRHPFTGASPGGWGWTNLSGAVPDGDDTPGAILALHELLPNITDETKQKKINEAVQLGIGWLAKLQNRDGGMPTFCRGWGILPFDRSCTDLTAHALRALHNDFQTVCLAKQLLLKDVVPWADGGTMDRAVSFLKKSQRKDGSWLPLWFGNQEQPDDANPFYGTARVLLALSTETAICFLNEFHSGFFSKPKTVQRGIDFLLTHQNTDGSWGNSVEETAVVVEALASQDSRQQTADGSRELATVSSVEEAYHRGLDWLLKAVEEDRFTQASPIGLYFAKLWYYEDLYPIIFTASALRRALQTGNPVP